MVDTTIEPGSDRAYEQGTPKPRQLKSQPRITIVYHTDLSRIGGMTPPEIFVAGRWVGCGRLSPEFVSPESNIIGGALEDPHISRNQFRIRWVGEQFELHPMGRRPMSVVELAPHLSEPVMRELERDTTVRLRPGTWVAIGNRVLLHLHRAPWTPPSADRLGMVGESELLWQVRRMIRQVVQFQKPALVLGPTGTGKELVARALHNLSERSQGPFVPINCAALPEHLAESLLFGHKKGAFTGATSDRDGAFVKAHRGSLFMDEIGELSLEIQAKLLRVLQERRLTTVGAHDSRPVDVRLMAATHRDFKAEIEAGNLREDFYYRIAVHPIRLPSLWERHSDVPMLFAHFLRRNTNDLPGLKWLWGDLSAANPPVPMGFFLDLMRYRWPGNIRELQNTVERVCRHNLDGGPFSAPFFYEQASRVLQYEQAAGSVVTATVVPPGPGLDEMDSVEVPSPNPDVSGPNKASQHKVISHLGMARKTVDRLLPDGFRPQNPNEPFDDYAEFIEGRLTDALLDLFDNYAFNQVRIAEHLNISRNTLIRLMKLFCIPRARDIDAEMLAQARAETGGSMEELAAYFDIPPRALELFLLHFNLKADRV